MAVLIVTAAGCGEQQSTPAKPTAAGSAIWNGDPAEAPALFPPVPAIVIPDVTALTTSSRTFAAALADLATPLSGVSVVGARCDTTGRIVNRAGLTQVNSGDGSGSFTDGALAVVNNGDGSGVYTDAGTTITVNGDGSGTYNDPDKTITINDDGSGTYRDAGMTITVNGDGSGTYRDAGTTLTVDDDGSGTYNHAGATITINNDGSGTYNDAGRTIVNNGDGTGKVNGIDTPMAPAPPLPLLGMFPRADALAPVGQACGTLIRIGDQVLFDFDKATLRPEAGAALDRLGTALAAVSGPLEINGHTDSKGADGDNLTLSQNRATAVVDGLRQRGVQAAMQATGLGEAQPIAPNERNGVDDPAGRQLNRRVEIVIPGS